MAQYDLLFVATCLQSDLWYALCSTKIENDPNGLKIILYTKFDMRNRLEMVSARSDFSFLVICYLDWKESENRNWLINQFWREKSIRLVQKSKTIQMGRKSSYKLFLTWGIDWKWFQHDRASLSWSSVPLMEKSPIIEKWSK